MQTNKIKEKKKKEQIKNKWSRGRGKQGTHKAAKGMRRHTRFELAMKWRFIRFKQLPGNWLTWQFMSRQTHTVRDPHIQSHTHTHSDTHTHSLQVPLDCRVAKTMAKP